MTITTSRIVEIQLPHRDYACTHDIADELSAIRKLTPACSLAKNRHYGIEISYLYDLTKPGEHTVRLERDMPPEIGSGIVKSNTVRITLGE